MAEYMKDIGLLDVDYAMTVSITFLNDAGLTEDKIIPVPTLGDNSY